MLHKEGRWLIRKQSKIFKSEGVTKVKTFEGTARATRRLLVLAISEPLNALRVGNSAVPFLERGRWVVGSAIYGSVLCAC